MLRPADKAGTWYPGSADRCRDRIAEFLDHVGAMRPPLGRPIGGIAPHAGWDFSGQTAAYTFAFLADALPETVVLFGSAHFGVSRAAVMASGAWQTPLGRVEVDDDLAAALLSAGHPLVVDDAGAHMVEHSIEILMPFVKYCFPDARALPIIPSPSAQPEAVGTAVAEAAGRLNRSVVVIGSTDLTHYGPNYRFAPKGTGGEALVWVREVNDRRFLDLAVQMSETAIVAEAARSHNACGPGAVAATIAACKHLGATRGHLLAYTTSHDVLPMGPPSSFVGYGAVGFSS